MPDTRRRRRPVVVAIDAVEPRVLFSTVAPAYADKIGLTGVVQASTNFEDNFDGTSLDKSKWQIREGARFRAYRDAPLSTVSYTNRSAIEVKNGEMVMHTYDDPTTGRVTTGWIQTNSNPPGYNAANPTPTPTLASGYSGNFNQKYGYWESRIKFNSMPGEWGAFWVHSGPMAMVTDSSQVNHPEIYGTEMDVAEHAAVRQGADASGQVSAVVHANGYVQYATDQAVHTTTKNLSPSYSDPSQYHVYGLYWTPTAAKFYLDGNLVNNVTDPSKVSKVEQYIIFTTDSGAGGSLQAGQGSNFFGYRPAGGYGDINTSQAKMTVDYVRVWGLANGTSTVNGGTPAIPPTPTPTPTGNTAVVSGNVFNDVNGNGNKDAGDVGVANAQLYLDLNYNGKIDAGEATATTDSAGAYRFASAPAQSFGITLAKTATFTPLSPASGQIAMRAGAGQTYQNRNFGVKLATTTTGASTASVGGTVYNDANGNGRRDTGEAPVANAKLYLDLNYNGKIDAGEATATTDSAGAYRFASAPAQSFGVTLVKASPIASFTSPGNGQIAMRAIAGQGYLNRDFGVRLSTTTPPPTPTPTATTATVGGLVWLDANQDGVWNSGEKGRAGVAVWLDYDGDNVYDAGEPTTLTSSAGAYLFTGVKVNISFAIRLRPSSTIAQTYPVNRGGLWLQTSAGLSYLSRNFGVRLLSGTGIF